MKFFESVSRTLAKQGVNTINGDMYDFISNWEQWYRGNVDSFHIYKRKMANGKDKKFERLTMNMAKQVCEDMAKLVWTEKTKIELDTEEGTERLWGVLDSKKNNFSVNLPEFIERAMALGTGMLVEYTSNDETLIDYIDADLIIPFEYNNSYVSGVATISRSTEKDDKKNIYYSLLTLHRFDGTTYSKEHQLYKGDSVNSLGERIPLGAKYPDLEELVEYPTETPHFQIFRPNIANNLDKTSPMGISIFANRIDNLKALDIKYDSFMNEFIMGKKRILVDRTAVKGSVDPETGTIAQYFDADDPTYMAVSGMDNQPIKEIDFNLRTDAHIKAINTDLKYLSTGVGLGNNYYNFDGGALGKTATEVISENSDTFRSKVSHEIILKDVLYDLVKVICELEGITYNNISILFDDSVVEDKNAEARQALIEFNAGLIDKVEYFVKAHGMEKQQAEDYIAEIEGRAPQQPEPEEEPEEE